MISIDPILAAKGPLVVGRSNARAVYVLCVFHQETEPSLRIWRDTGDFRCYGCHEEGTMVDLVAHCLGIDQDEALEMLSDGWWLPTR